eukprot:COSAG06_NODE_26910_length_605_cov_0.557312_1_plen_161_part_00
MYRPLVVTTAPVFAVISLWVARATSRRRALPEQPHRSTVASGCLTTAAGWAAGWAAGSCGGGACCCCGCCCAGRTLATALCAAASTDTGAAAGGDRQRVVLIDRWHAAGGAASEKELKTALARLRLVLDGVRVSENAPVAVQRAMLQRQLLYLGGQDMLS